MHCNNVSLRNLPYREREEGGRGGEDLTLLRKITCRKSLFSLSSYGYANCGDCDFFFRTVLY